MKRISDILPSNSIISSKADLRTHITGVADDSRGVSQGHLFFAIPGKHSDGTQFIDQAFERGAAAIVVEDEATYKNNNRCIRVRSVRSALAFAGCTWNDNPSQHMDVVGITGTNGKTTSSFLLHSVWESLGVIAGLIGTVEYRYGTHVQEAPLTTPGSLFLQGLLADMKQAGVEKVAMEVSSIALEQHRTQGTRFKVGVFTNLTQDHLDYHHDFENYFQAKKNLFTKHPVEFAAINIDDPWGERLLKELPSSVRPYTFGLQKSSDVHPLSTEFSFDGTRAAISVRGKKLRFVSPLIGAHNLLNCLGVITTCECLDLPIDSVCAALSQKTGAPGRLERVAGHPDRPAVFVDYAHTPDALHNVLHALQDLKRSRIITVFGCGGDRDRTKRPLMGKAVSQASDVTIATSDNPRTEEPESIIDEIEKGVDLSQTIYHRDSDRAAAIRHALSIATPNDIVLIAGKGHETYQIIGTKKLPFDDRQVIRDHYAKLN